MPRPQTTDIAFTIDGREVTAPANMMLVDAAKLGDVEIPVFCYEPKLGQPVGACRMCLVEVEGIPKLQTACSTPVKDGMVVHTQTQRVHEAQRAVVEFLLVNHPLDCPVCDKGGECPLQDITYGWGPGISRFVEPKRHFKKPLELSPLVNIDRERCILCYRCVRFSQEVAEDHQLVLLERGAAAFVGTFDGRPYVAPFSGNITDLCPVGALLPSSYRFRARPWDIEGSGTVCTLCPAQCNVTLTVRDERVMRVMARDNSEVDDGWLCDKGRFAFQHVHVDERITQPLVREGTELRPASWDKALSTAATALQKAGGRAAALAGGETTNEEAFLLQKLFREGLGSGHLASRLGGDLPVGLTRALADPRLQATVPDLEFAHSVLVLDCDPVDDMSILDLRIRKGIRRHGVRLAVASARPTALDANARATIRFAPGAAEAFLVALDAALGADEGNLGGGASAAGARQGDVRAMAEALRDNGEDVVILFHERLVSGARGASAATALLNVTTRLGLSGRTGAGLLCIPASANGRGLAEAGFAAAHGPGYSHVERPGRDAPGIADALAAGDLGVLYLMHADPLRQAADRNAWAAALGAAQTVIAHESVLTETVREFADVVFPAEGYPEKEGTIVHPDGRLQRLRPAIGRPRAGDGAPGSGVRPAWQVVAELARRVGAEDFRVAAAAIASQQLFETVPFYAGLTLDALAGKGARWTQREAAAALGAPEWELDRLSVPPAAPAANGSLRLGTFRTLWASKEVDVSPILQFARPDQVVELSPGDAEALGVRHGDDVEVRSNGHSVQGRAHIRAAVPAGSVFLAEGTARDAANVLAAAALVEVIGPAGPGGPPAGTTSEGAGREPGASDGVREENAGAGRTADSPTQGGPVDPDTHAAEVPGSGDQTADAPDGPPAGGSGPHEATGGSSAGETSEGGEPS